MPEFLVVVLYFKVCWTGFWSYGGPC